MIEIRTLNLEIKNLEYQEEFDFDTSENFIDRYKEINIDLNHLFIIHPPALDELDDIITLLTSKNGSWFIILLSSDEKILIPYSNEKNIWAISYGVPNKNTKKENFNDFYQEIQKNENVSDIKSIEDLIIKHLDPIPNLTPKIEQDIILIKMWKSMGNSQDWKKIKDFKNYSEEQFKEIEYYLGKIS